MQKKERDRLIKQKRDRKQQSLDSRSHYDGLVKQGVNEKAVRAFRHKPYQVDEYVKTRGIDTEGEIAGGL